MTAVVATCARAQRVTLKQCVAYHSHAFPARSWKPFAFGGKASTGVSEPDVRPTLDTRASEAALPAFASTGSTAFQDRESVQEATKCLCVMAARTSILLERTNKTPFRDLQRCLMSFAARCVAEQTSRQKNQLNNRTKQIKCRFRKHRRGRALSHLRLVLG